MTPGCYLAFFSLSFLTFSSQGQVVKFRSCLQPSVHPTFNVTQYLGEWYEVQRYFPIFFEQNLMCTTATYNLNTDGSINVSNRAVNRFTRVIEEIEGSAKIVSNAKLNVNFGEADNNFGSTPQGNYWVLSTDYKNFAVVYSCTEFFATIALEIVWILGRTPTLSRLITDNIYFNLTRQGIDIVPFRRDIQGTSDVDCRNYYKEKTPVG